MGMGGHAQRTTEPGGGGGAASRHSCPHARAAGRRRPNPVARGGVLAVPRHTPHHAQLGGILGGGVGERSKPWWPTTHWRGASGRTAPRPAHTQRASCDVSAPVMPHQALPMAHSCPCRHVRGRDTPLRGREAPGRRVGGGVCAQARASTSLFASWCHANTIESFRFVPKRLSSTRASSG